VELAGREIPFAELDHLDSGGEPSRNVVEQCDTCGQLSTVGDVVADYAFELRHAGS
jgi:hypothetical protein